MTPEVLAALRRIVDEVGADAGVLVRLTPSGAGVVTSSTLVPAVAVGDAWGAAGALEGTQVAPELALEPARLRDLVPPAAQVALPAPLTAALVAPLADTMSRIVLLWAQSSLPDDVVGQLGSGSFHRFSLLAPLLDAQVQAQEVASRLRAEVAALDQAVVLTATGSGAVEVNGAAAGLLGRGLPGCASIPIVVVTADASPGARERMMQMGSDGFLTKPIDLDDVLGWIDDTTPRSTAP